MNALKDIRQDDGTLPAYAWPGGYPMYYLDDESNVLCPNCANADGYSSEPVAYDINWEDDSLTCDDCGKTIECAYCARPL